MSSKSTQTSINIWVNPLRILSLEEAPFNAENTTIDSSALITELIAENTEKNVNAVRTRYSRLTELDGGLFLVPVDDLILDKLIWPLRSAKQAFCLGNYLGCIALAGMVAEMVVVFLFDLSKPSFSGVPLSEDAQKALFGSTFEKLGQERRISILKTLGILSDDLQIAAERIKTIRRAYLHILSKDSAKIETEAEECYKFATSLVREVVALNPADGGTISIPNRLANYLGRPHEGTK